MTHPQVRRLWCGVAAVMALAGCTQTTVTPSPSTTIVGTGPVATGSPSPAATPAGTPTPTSFTCTPEAGGAPTPCAPAEYETSRQRDALYAEAEQVYRQFVKYDEELLKSGKPASGPVMDLLAGPMVERYKARTQEQVNLGITMTGTLRLAALGRAAGYAREGSDVALVSCLDGSSLRGMKGSETLGTGDQVVYNTYFKRFPSGMKIVYDEGKKVAKC